MQKFIRAATVAAAALGAISVGAIAHAESNGIQVGKYRSLNMDALHYDSATGDSTPSDCSTIGWTATGGDSPLDNNNRALRVYICPVDTSGSDYAQGYSHASYAIDRPVGDVKNLSWDEKVRTDGTHGSGAPRFSIELSDGSIAYLASGTCGHELFNSGGTWQRADFTGFHNDCSFHVTSGAGDTVYSADGTNSAWQNFALQNPDLSVKHLYMIWDEPGFYRLDRIAFVDDMYNYSPHRVVSAMT
jgi:hypothetical protein